MRSIPTIGDGARFRLAAAVVAIVAVVGVGACGDEAAEISSGERPTIVATTSVLGDVVANVVGGAADVVVIMPPGASPHEFQPSPRDVVAIRSADALVVNGGGLEEGLADLVEQVEADGVPTFEAAPASGVAAEEDDHGDDAEAEADAADDHGHAHDGRYDPHYFTSPAAMVSVVEAMVAFLVEDVASIDADDVSAGGESYLDELRSLDEEVRETLDVVPSERRVLITNHDVMAAFADRYGFEVIGTIIPGASTTGAADASTLARLIGVIRDAQVPAIFVDVSSSDQVARAIASEAGDVEVVPLYTEALGEGGSEAATYVAMMRTNARRIAEALK